jgi:hypothetical protein
MATDSWLHGIYTYSLGEARDPMRNILGPELGARIKPIWGLDSEGEIKGAWRDLGIPRLWCMMGELFCCEKKTKKTILNPVQGTLPCVDSTRNTLLCVRFSLPMIYQHAVYFASR